MLPPLYPLLLASVFILFGTYSTTSALVILTLNSIFSAATAWPIFAIGTKLFAWQAGLLAALIWAVFPAAIFWSATLIWPTTLSGLMLSVALLLSLHLLERSPQPSHWLLFGALWGVIALTNTALVSILPPLLGWLLWKGKRVRGRRLLVVCLTLVGLAAVVLPWTVRNYSTFGKVILVRDSGQELYLGNVDGATGSRMLELQAENNPDAMNAYRSLGERAYFERLEQAADQWIKADPMRFVRLSAERIFYFWVGFWGEGGRSGVKELALWIMFTIGYAGLSLLTLFGFVAALRRCDPSKVVVLGIFVFFAPVAYYITYAHPRFRHPIEPIMVLFAAYALTSIFSSLRLRGVCRLQIESHQLDAKG